jgi:hypothetical protein
MHFENNYEEWKEIRARADSVANIIFIIAAGALSLSMNLMLSNKVKLIFPKEVIDNTTFAWYLLLVSIGLFILLKVQFICHAMLLQFAPDFIDAHLSKFNISCLVVGALAISSFIWGMYEMVEAAVKLLGL